MCAHIVTTDYNLLAMNPALAGEWHPDNILRPDQVTPSSGKRVLWKCREGHTWEARIDKRSSGKGCPECFRQRRPPLEKLAVTHPHLCAEWNYERNGALSPDAVTSSSKKRVWWKCEKGHEWLKRIDKRSQGRGCPLCAIIPLSDEYCFTRLKTEFAIEWHPFRNGALTPWDVKPCSGKIVWWLCRAGHEWQCRVSYRYAGSRCPGCSGKALTDRNSLEARFPRLAVEWNYERNGRLHPSDVRPYSTRRVWWKCRWGHEWQARIDKRTDGSNCPMCRKCFSTKSNFIPRLSF